MIQNRVAAGLLLQWRSMRVVDLDRDMSDVIPTGATPDSEFLFARMTELTLESARTGPGCRILDVASGVGQDTIALGLRGARAVGVEPSQRMTEMARLFADRRELPLPGWVRGWSDALPFASGSFDAAICKGALDHFDRPDDSIEEMARVTRSGGRVVLAIANFESLACRLGRVADELREGWLRQPPRRGRRSYDTPSDHFTRYDLDLMREQAARHLDRLQVRGVSLGWGISGWSRVLAGLPAPVARAALGALDWIAGRAPALSDVAILVGQPRRAASTSL